MKGIVFNLLEEVIQQVYGADTWDNLLDAAGLDGAYTSLGSYADEEVAKLVMAASAALGTPPDEVMRWFGRKAMPLLAARYPAFFAGHTEARSFLLTLNNIIHPEVEKLYPGASTPVFDFGDSTGDALEVGYRSARRMCALAEGFMLGAADHYGQTLAIEHPVCMHNGAPKCQFRITFSR